MKKQKLAKLSLRKAKVANLKRVNGGGWNQGPTIHASEDTECQTASCLCGDPGEPFILSKVGNYGQGMCASIAADGQEQAHCLNR